MKVDDLNLMRKLLLPKKLFSRISSRTPLASVNSNFFPDLDDKGEAGYVATRIAGLRQTLNKEDSAIFSRVNIVLSWNWLELGNDMLNAR